MDNFDQSFYLYLPTEDKQKYPTSEIKTVDDLRANLLSWADFSKDEEYKGWNPEDYTSQYASDFENMWDSVKHIIRNESLEGLSNFVQENNIILSYQHPDRLTERDFEDDNNPIFVDLDEATERERFDPMEAMEREYNDWPGGAELALKELNEQDKIADQQKLLTEKFMFERDIKHLSTDNLKVLAQAFGERSDEDPSFEWKKEICEEVLEKKLERDFEMDR